MQERFYKNTNFDQLQRLIKDPFAQQGSTISNSQNGDKNFIWWRILTFNKVDFVVILT